MYRSETYVRVRYGETDQMGYVYYGYYAMYYEVARVEALRSLGLTYKALEEMGIIMPVLENHSWFLAPGRYDEQLRIVTTIPEIFNEANVLINRGHSLLAFVNRLTNRPVRPPQVMTDVLKPFFL